MEEKKPEEPKVEEKKPEAPKVEEKKPEASKTEEKKPEEKAKTDSKQSTKPAPADDTVTMNTEAMTAYASTIAEAAEDSEPEKPVLYQEYKEVPSH